MQSKQALENQKAVVSRLLLASEIADRILRERNLYKRTKNLDEIKNEETRRKEKRRQNFSKYVGEPFLFLVTDSLKRLNNGAELLHQFNSIDLHGQSATSANILEIQLLKVNEIVNEIEKNPEKYISAHPLDKNTRYNKAIGELSQFIYSYPVSGEAKKLIDYIWGKRKITYLDRSSEKLGRPLTITSIINNTGISIKRLRNVIDNFNSQMKTEKRKMNVYIKRDRFKKTLQLEVTDEFPTRN